MTVQKDKEGQCWIFRNPRQPMSYCIVTHSNYVCTKCYICYAGFSSKVYFLLLTKSHHYLSVHAAFNVHSQNIGTHNLPREV